MFYKGNDPREMLSIEPLNQHNQCSNPLTKEQTQPTTTYVKIGNTIIKDEQNSNRR